MQDLFDITKFDSYKEDNRREVKRANGGLPISLWDTYSAFANCYGGVIILGVKEDNDKSWKTTGLKRVDRERLIKEFWDTINNYKKVSINLLSDDDVEVYDVGEDIVIVIYVPMAKREQKPVFINDNMFGGTFKRNHEGDYHCTKLQVKSMLRDQTESTMDMRIMEDMTIDQLDQDTIHSYRNRHRSFRPGHPWANLSDAEYLQKIGAAEMGRDKELHPTAAGLLMFGEENRIVREYPEYFLDYREMLDPTIRWTDRLQSSSGEWSGNLFDFYFRVYNKITKNVKVPFKMIGGDRIDDTPVHRALREVLANCLVNTDFFVPRGVVIRQEDDMLILENPGSIRVGKYQMKLGGESDPRNKALMKMFNLIDIGERAGSGVPELFAVWEHEGWEEPQIEERQDSVERTTVTLSFKKKSDEKKPPKKTAEKNRRKKPPKKTLLQYETILSVMEPNIWYRASEFMDILGIKESRTKELLRELVAADLLEDDGATKGKKYRKISK
ncbi:MAG: putative DNA binding domain-containing protein [Lachnospiraceae bacterium]|nr:putative DNA binding domain-containing protein [Lachnospiraceae bacterium]